MIRILVEPQQFQNNMKRLCFILICLMLFNCTKFPEIGNGYKLDYNSRGDIGIVYSNNKYIIYGHILEYAFDNNFIIVAERPRSVIPECTGKIKGTTKADCDKAFEKSTFVQFYIIDKKSGNTIGALNKEDYNQKKSELGVPEKLLLKNY